MTARRILAWLAAGVALVAMASCSQLAELVAQPLASAAPAPTASPSPVS